MAVGEVFLSAFLQVLFDRMASKQVLDFIRGCGVEEKMKKMKKTLMILKAAVLEDAEERQTKNEAVKIWLDELRNVVYDVEDVLDEFVTEALRCKLEAESKTISSQVWSLLPASLNPNVFMFNVELESKINEIIERLDDVVKQRLELGLREVGGSSSRVRETSSMVDESHVYGRDDDREQIMGFLLRDESRCDEKVSIIPIVGMGGVGKTTLAQIVYNDDIVKKHFDLRAWVYVSDDFDVMRITKAILESVTSQTCDFKYLDMVQVKLSEALIGKRFLLVLDDMWSKKYGDWDVLQNPFKVGVQGSRIIVTTRNKDVALMVGTVNYHHLEHLSEADCWSVFVHHASKGNIDLNSRRGIIGKKIVEKCKGLPLAAKTLGGILRFRQEDEEWEDIFNSEIWDLPDWESDILSVLRLSYHHLPSHLKRCFMYCSIFPKDYEFVEKELVLLWIAEGFVQQPKGKKKLEDIGREYFGELLSRSLFQQSAYESRYVMHDLIHDLAQSVAGEVCFRMEDMFDGDNQVKISGKTRHSSFLCGRYDGIKKFKVFYAASRLRTFLPSKRSVFGACYLTMNVPFDLLPKLRCLRVLSLSGYEITELPSSMGELKHLRYLDLSHTQIKELPESTSALYNLQTLIVENCQNLMKLPANLGNLINLQHLNNSNTNSLQEMPPQMSRLTSLQTLSSFVVGKGSDSGIRELRNMLHLQGTLSILKLENVTDACDAREANFIHKQDLDVLVMEWSSKFDDLRNERIETRVLGMLEPHPKLEVLTIKYYGGISFPTWVGDPLFSQIVMLRLINCEKCTFLPPLGQLPSLKSLLIREMTGVKIVGPEFYGECCSKPFSSLEVLSFEDMREWEYWFSSGVDNEIEAFPNLCKLYIERCPKLMGTLPEHLPSLKRLVICECQQLAVSLPSMPSLCKLDIDESDQMAWRSMVTLTSLNSLVISNISKLNCLPEQLMHGLTNLVELKIDNCMGLTSLWETEFGLQFHTSLSHLVIKDCYELVSLVDDGQMGLPCNLKSLELRSCDNLEKLPQGLHSLTSLTELTIYGCPGLVSFTEKSLPSTLRRLCIENCRNLGSPTEMLMHNSNNMRLEYLRISKCPSLTTFPRGQLPATLKEMEILDCENLQCLLEVSPMQKDMSLKHLHIEKCPSLTTLSRSEFPPTVIKLVIHDCRNLGSLPASMQNNTSLEHISISNTNLKSLPKHLHNLMHLCKLSIHWCDSLVSFPAKGLPTTNLRELSISLCGNLKALPNSLNKLSSLQVLKLLRCPHIVSFPEGGLPANLKALEIQHLKIIEPTFEWGLHRLTFLQELSIHGGSPDLVSFPEEGLVLPNSLTKLSIGFFPNLEYLTKGLQSLTSLEYLKISYCPKLTFLPKEGLPLSLLCLIVNDSPLLKQRCSKINGQDWLKIAHIPYVCIDDEFIFDSNMK